MRLAKRAVDLTASPIAEAHAWLPHRSGDRSLLDLSQAAPSYPTAPEIAAHVAEVARRADGGRYAPPTGLPALREAFAAELTRDYGTPIGPEHVLPTGGCNQAFCVVLSALTEPGDEVILPVPYYFNHDMWLRLEGIRPAYLHPVRPSSFDDPTALVPDPERAASIVGERTRAIVLVTPANPTGVTTPPDVLAAFRDLAVERGLVLVLDETYRNFRPASEPAHDLFGCDDWAEHVVSLHSFSKDLAIPGYRVGAVVAGEALLYETLKFVDCLQISAPRIGQEAVVAGLTMARTWRREQAARIAATQRAFEQVMVNRPGGFELVAAGAFFGWVRHPFEARTDEIVKRLVLDHDVLAIPGTAFTPADGGFLRFSFANVVDDEVHELGRRLAELG